MPIYRVDIPGQLPSGEQFLFGFHASDLSSTDADAATDAEAWLGGFMATSGGAAPLFSASTIFGPVKVSQIDAATDKVISSAFGTLTKAGTGTGSVLPPQVAVCVTLRTALAGPSNRGRFYLPATLDTTLESNTGRMAAASVTQLVGALGNAFTLYAGSPGTPQVIVRSKTHHNAQNATRYEVGNVFDTQRRRRDKLFEVRSGGLV